MLNKTIEFNDNMLPVPRAFNTDDVVICFCTSNKYAPYCGITLQSIIENSNSSKNYDILIMEYDITDYNKKLILSLVENVKNFSVRFINVLNGLATVRVQTWAHFSVVACFKLFLFSKPFVNYTKVLALDTDLIFQRDAAELFNIEIEDNLIAAVDDVIMKEHVASETETKGFSPNMKFSQYISEYLGFNSSENYYNTGVVILNLSEFRKIDAYSKAFFLLKSKGYVYQEQDVLNDISVGRIKDIALNWNVVGTDNIDKICDSISVNDAESYRQALENPYIVHFAGGKKPWTHSNVLYSELFFKYAKHTPWYENIIMNIPVNYTRHIEDLMKRNIIAPKKPFKVRLRDIADKAFPFGGRKRELIKKIFPRDSVQRKFVHDAVMSLTPEFRSSKKAISTALNKNTIYIRNLDKRLIKHGVLLDSKNGTDLAGNIFRIIEELSKQEYKEYKLFLTYRQQHKPRIEAILEKYKLSNIILVEWLSSKHFKLLARCKYLVTDLYMPFEFVKRENQILISTAHGTPLKVMGKDCHTETQGHLQRTHVLSDYQTFPSAYMKEKLFGGFMENNLYTGHAMKSGYCRNIIFYNHERREKLRKELDFEGKKVTAYLPTFRGIAGTFHSEQQVKDVTEFCFQLDSMMKEDEIFLIKLHNFNILDIDFSTFKHIKKFPSDYEVYDVLNATDVLVSDYSSVFFDYANTRNKIVLFQYDYDEYMSERGVYLSWDELPFPIVKDAEQLYQEISTPKTYDDTEFLKKYCTFDGPDVVRNVCKTIFKNENNCADFESTHNGKKNIMIHIGNFDLRSPTTVLVQEFFNRIDTSKANFFVFFYEYDLFRSAHRLECLPSNVEYLTYLAHPQLSKNEHRKYKKHLNGDLNFSSLDKTFKRECRKAFCDLPIDLYIDLSGSFPDVAEFSANLNCKKIIVEQEHKFISDQCLKKYDAILSYKDYSDLSEHKDVIYLKSGYSSEILKENVKNVERLCFE